MYARPDSGQQNELSYMTSHKLDETAAGVFIISATPFSEDGALDLDSADRLVDFYIEKGVSGITVLGMMGEAQKNGAGRIRDIPDKSAEARCRNNENPGNH